MNKRLLVSILTAALSLTYVSSALALSYGGSATGAEVTVPATGTTIRAATGALSISGGGAESSLLVGDVPGSVTGGVVSLSAGVMHSSIVGLDATRAEASMGDVALTVSGNQITADFLMARSTASCGPAVVGSSELTNLVINGQPITVTGAPNQTVTLPNGTVVINQQASSIVGSSAELVVSALHVTTTDPVTQQQLADVLLATVDAKIDCTAGSPPNASFGTGGGFVLGNVGGRATFGVVGGVEHDGSFTAHVVYNDHDANFSFRSTSITDVDNGTLCQTTITGSGEVNGTPGFGFTVTITDGGEPGANRDQFSIEVPNFAAYPTNVNKTLLNGNIQKHRDACP